MAKLGKQLQFNSLQEIPDDIWEYIFENDDDFCVSGVAGHVEQSEDHYLFIVDKPQELSAKIPCDRLIADYSAKHISANKIMKYPQNLYTAIFRATDAIDEFSLCMIYNASSEKEGCRQLFEAIKQNYIQRFRITSVHELNKRIAYLRRLKEQNGGL